MMSTTVQIISLIGLVLVALWLLIYGLCGWFLSPNRPSILAQQIENKWECMIHHRIACPEFGYLHSEARYMDIIHWEMETGNSWNDTYRRWIRGDSLVPE